MQALFKKTRLLTIVVLGLCLVASLGFGGRALALSGSDFNAGRIIDDAVFFNPNTMNPGDIQTFLNSKVPVCDTNGTQPYAGTTRAAYSASKGYPAPFTCLKDFSQSVPAKAPDAYCTGSVSAGTKSAAQIIYDVGQACGVSPKVLLVTLQKESGLVTDDWPWSVQYATAMGYACPDTSACDPSYADFFSQIYSAARQFQLYVKRADLFNFTAGQTSFVQYNPNSGCGGSNVFMQNQITAGLYNYTPYQPNQAALNNLGGSGDSCSAYGNRNFWYYYINWFGSTFTSSPYAWMYEGSAIYSDTARTQQFTSIATAIPSSKVYVRLKARNMGTQSWNNTILHLGTSRPLDRPSQFYDSSLGWINSARPAGLIESSVSPGQIGTFEFAMQAPSGLGTYNEYFNLVADGITWLNDLGAYFTINVNNPATTSTTSTLFNSGNVLNNDDYILSPEGESALTLQKDGNLVLYSNFQPVWSTGPTSNSSKLVMQADGNLVLYNQAMSPLWSSQTNGNNGAHLELQTDGNLVIYSSSHTPLWATYSLHNPDHRSYINTTLNSGRLYPGQSLDTADRRYHLILQGDGNLVLYSPNRAIWATGTDGKSVSFLAMQGDGNLVLYDKSGKPLWYSSTSGRRNMHLTIQQDGNLVLYNVYGTPYWNTQTNGAQ